MSLPFQTYFALNATWKLHAVLDHLVPSISTYRFIRENYMALTKVPHRGINTSNCDRISALSKISRYWTLDRFLTIPTVAKFDNIFDEVIARQKKRNRHKPVVAYMQITIAKGYQTVDWQWSVVPGYRSHQITRHDGSVTGSRDRRPISYTRGPKKSLGTRSLSFCGCGYKETTDDEPMLPGLCHDCPLTSQKTIILRSKFLSTIELPTRHLNKYLDLR
ncbi:hypothetical protein HUJ04_012442 [Dendroctonus ponderosae]|nr:hypothetical protein HUJ04_012442 [Dendroctonus ponderosae]KAH1029645.1 hypothetical protein HUJ05_002843 [Dendroctonus ponderosae]